MRRVSRVVRVAAKTVGALIATAVLAAGILAATAPSAGSSLSQPKTTSTPSAPGIVVVPPQSIDLPDPMFVTSRGKYHVYLSTAFGDSAHVNVPEIVGVPGHWGPVFEALPTLPAWSRTAAQGNKVWDPYVQRIGGRYLLYYSTEIRAPGRLTHCLAVARSTSAAGPFSPVGSQPLVCQRPEGGDIDVQPYYDPTGPGGKAHPWYLIWKSDGNNLKQIRPTYIWAAPLSNDGLRLTGTARQIFRATLPWEQPVLEAPQMVRSPDGRTWLFFSAGAGFYKDRYAMGVAACDGPLGGCHDARPDPIISTNAQGAGPGEETVFVAPDHSYWLLYNPWHTGLGFLLLRPAEGVRIGWNADGPYVAEAGTFPAPPPAWPRVGHPRIG